MNLFINTLLVINENKALDVIVIAMDIDVFFVPAKHAISHDDMVSMDT